MSAFANKSQAILAQLQGMDLGPIRFKLMSKEGENWDRALVDKVEPAYRMFLALSIAHPEAAIAPSVLVDKMWHHHILDTQKYHEDCSKYLGQFLHHFPYFGMRGDKDKTSLQAAGTETAELYMKEFNFDVSTLKSDSSLCGPDNCDPQSPSQLNNNKFNWARPSA